MNLIIFRVDSSNIIGAGHIHRCICLAKALKDRNNRIVFFCRKLKGNLINLIIKNKFKVYINKKIVKDKHMNIWTEKNQEEDYKFIRSKIKKKADMLICDHYGLGISWRKKIKLITKKLFIIDDKDSNNNYCDFYLNHNINVSKKRYDSHSKNKTVFLEGLDYLITGQNLKFRKKKIKKNRSKNIFFSMGSVDKKNLTGKFYNFISHKIFNSYKINIMIGKNFRNKKSFFNKIKIKNNIKFVKPNIKSFQNFYKNFDTVFSGVNTTMYEQLQYGFKPFCISQNKIQTDNGKRLNNKKYINLINLNKINQINLKKKIEKNVNFFSKPQSSLSKKLKKNTLYKVCNIIKKNI